MAKKVDYKKYNCVLEMSKWMGSTPKAFKAGNPERGCAARMRTAVGRWKERK